MRVTSETSTKTFYALFASDFATSVAVTSTVVSSVVSVDGNPKLKPVRSWPSKATESDANVVKDIIIISEDENSSGPSPLELQIRRTPSPRAVAIEDMQTATVGMKFHSNKCDYIHMNLTFFYINFVFDVKL